MKMRILLSIVAFLMVLACLPIGLINVFNNDLIIGFCLLLWVSFILPACITDIKQSLKKVNKSLSFTLIELIAVITIISILLTIAFRAMSIDPSKADITRIKSDLVLLQTQCRVDSESDEVREFKLADNYFSDVTMSHDSLFFNKQGEPIDIDGNQLINFYIQAHDPKSNPIKVFIRPFTGKVTFLEL